jgi:broad specificity phosphatase PhoE
VLDMTVRTLPKRAWWGTLIAVLLVAVLVIAAPGLIAPKERCDTPPTVVLLLRHAEKAAAPAADPPLTSEGTARAARLIHLAKDSGARTIYATEFLRTQQTVQPLAAQLGIAVTTRPAADVDGLVADIRDHRRGEVVVVAGHSNTIPQIIQKLGGGTVPDIADSDFDNLYVLTIPCCGNAKTVRLHLPG